MWMTPVHRIAPAKSMFMPARFDTVSAVQASPP